MRLAADDLESIGVWVAEESNAEVASKHINKLLERAEEIGKMGRRREELNSGRRSIAEGAYVLFYREMEKGVELMRVIHGRRDLEQALDDDQLVSH